MLSSWRRSDRTEPGQEGSVQRERPLLPGLPHQRGRGGHARLQVRMDQGEPVVRSLNHRKGEIGR